MTRYSESTVYSYSYAYDEASAFGVDVAPGWQAHDNRSVIAALQELRNGSLVLSNLGRASTQEASTEQVMHGSGLL